MKKIVFLLILTSLLFASCIVNSNELVSIVISEAPSKVEYVVGETVDVSGMVVNAIFSNQEIKELKSNDYTYSPIGPLTLSDTKITVSYTFEGVTKVVIQNITVKEAKVETTEEDKKTSEEEKKEENTKEETETPAKTFFIKERIGENETELTYEEKNNTITLVSNESEPVFILSGEYKGQIIISESKLPNLVKSGDKTHPTIILNKVKITNDNGKPAIISDTKLEIKAEKETENVISATRTTEVKDGEKVPKYGTIHCEAVTSDGTDLKSLDIGGQGKLTVTGLYHGIKAKNIEVKGKVTLNVTGSDKGSCINCKDFLVEEGKEVTLNLSKSKNGIKADNTITILSGKLNLKNLSVGLKTDTSEDDKPGETKTHSITLKNCEEKFTSVTTEYETEEKGFTRG